MRLQATSEHLQLFSSLAKTPIRFPCSERPPFTGIFMMPDLHGRSRCFTVFQRVEGHELLRVRSCPTGSPPFGVDNTTEMSSDTGPDRIA